MKQHQKSFTGLIRLWGIIILAAIGTCVIIIDIISSYSDFHHMADQLRTSYITKQQEMVKREVEHVVNLIRYGKKQSETVLKEKLNERINEAFDTANTLIKENSKASQKKIIDSIRPGRLGNITGHYFAISLDGKELLYTEKLKKEERNMMNIRDTRGKYLVRDMIEIAETTGEGFYKYYWAKDTTIEKGNEKIAFVKLLKPFNFLIGASLCIDEAENRFKDNLLAIISNIRYGSDGYVFVNRMNGDALVANGSVVTGNKKLWEVFNKNPEKTKKLFNLEYEAAMRPKGDFIYYSIPKLSAPDEEARKTSFIYGIQEWDWLVGAGVYLDDAEANISLLKHQLTLRIVKKNIRFSFFVFLIIVVFLFFFNRLNQKLISDFRFLNAFFNRAALSDEKIDKNEIKFKELIKITESVNKMISDKASAKQALMAERKQLYVTIRSIGEGIITTNTKGQIELMNSVAETLTGCSNNEAHGKSLEDIFSVINSETGESIVNPVTRVLETGDIVESSYHANLVSSDGNTYFISHTAAPINDESDSISGIVLVFRDVSQEYRMRSILRESEKNFRILMEQSPIAMQIYDLDGNLVAANKALANLWDIPELHEIMNSFNILKDKYMKKIGLIPLIEKVFEGEQINIPEIEFNPFDAGLPGRKRFVRLKAYPLMDSDNTFKHIVLFLEDITEHKQTQKEMLKMQKLKSIGTLAAGIAHDFNNILMGAIGYLELATTGEGNNDDKTGYIKLAENALTRARRLTTQLLTFARGGAPILRAVNTKELVSKSVNFNLSGSNVKADFNMSDDLKNVSADWEQLYEVFANLTINAKQAMPDGGHLSVTAENISHPGVEELPEKSGRFVKITLCDDGVGIPKENLDKVFDPYFTTKELGSGLGLATVQSIITKHKGHINIESVPEKETCVTIYLPVENQQDAYTTETIPKKSPQTQKKLSGRALIVDDEDLIKQVTSALLEKIGFNVEVASEGEEALALYKKSIENNESFDIVIMDLTIPGGIGGKEAIKHIINADPNAIVIVSSGYFTDPVIVNYQHYGFKGRLVKPFQMEDLINEIKKVLPEHPIPEL